jgi:hypothetical protein
MRIQFTKLSDDVHLLAIEPEGKPRQEVRCETRSYLLHDLLHYAVEGEAGLGSGFWGSLAAGKTLAQMNDRTGAAMADAGPELGAVEQIVGALHGTTKGIASADLIAGLRRFATALGQTLPNWVTDELIVAVQERMRRLQGHWRATPHGGVMELPWPPPTDR